ncbi:cdk-12 [Symbiodinium sp. CCMP2592]|nr:cdk-12 [Symbiodinium sp. CCMP2592]
MRDSFWQDVRGRSIEVVQGQLAVDKLATEFGQVAGKIFGKKKVVPVVEALRVLQADSVRRSLSQDRRRLAEKIFSRLVARLAEAIDASKGKTVWMANRVESLEQLRTARGYRKVSHGCQEAVLQAGSAAGPSIAAALQSQKHLTSSVEEKTTRNRDKPGKFLESERLSYCSSGQSTFSSTTVLSVVADAVHVGDDDWLNVFVCDPGCDLSFFCPPQVKKGTCLTAENFVDMWQGRITKFFQKAGTKGRSAGKSTGGVREPERQATQEWLRDVSHSLSAVGWSWSSCGPSADSAKRPNVIVLCTDQEATQLAAVNYLKFGRSLFVEFVNDPAHRSHNDVHLAMASAGLLTFALVSLGLYNVRYGPWNKGTWFGKVQSMADEMSLSMSPSDPLLLTFFPDILADEGRSQEENTEENRRLFLEGLPNRSFVRSKGSKASHSRFNSLSIAHSELDRDWSSFCLVLAALCIAEGWTTSASALWAPGAGKVQEASTGSRSAAKAAARKTMQQQRSSSVNTLHGMTSFACSPDNRSLARTIFFVLQPEGVRCSKMLEELRSFDATVSTYAAWAHWGYVETAREHLVRLSDLAALQRLGLNMAMDHDDDCDEAALVYQDTLARRVVKLTVRLLRFRCGSQLPSTNGWGATAGLLHDSTASRQASLQFLKAVDVTVKAVQETGSLDAKTMLEGHPATGPVMGMVLAELRAASFVEVPPGTFDFLRRCWGGLLNSKLVEDANKVQREAEQRNGTAKTLGRLEGWHGLSRKRLFKDYGRSEVPNGTLVTLPTSFDADAWFVRKKRRTTSGSIATGSASSSQPAVAEETAEEAVCKGVSQARTWASHTPDSEQDKLAGFSLLAKVVRESKDWSFVEKGWWSSLVPEGHGLAFPGSDSVCFVVRTYKRAALVWPATLDKGPSGVERLVLDTTAASLCWVHVFDENVEVLDLVATSPQRVLAVQEYQRVGLCDLVRFSFFEVRFRCPKDILLSLSEGHKLYWLYCLRSLGETRPLGVAFRVQARHSLLRHHELHGFAGVPEWSLRKLAQAKKWPVSVQEAGHEEDDRLAIVCLLSLDPSLVKEEVVGRLLSRQEAAPWSFDTGIDLEELVRDTMLAADQEQALKHLANKKAGQASAKDVRKRASHTYEHVAKTFAGRPEYKKFQAQRKEKEKKAVQEQKARAAEAKRVYDDVNVDVDRVLKAAVPPGVRVYTDDRNGRWSLTYSTAWAFATRSISWTQVGSKPAGRAAVEQSWDWAETFAGLAMSDEAATILKKLSVAAADHQFQCISQQQAVFKLVLQRRREAGLSEKQAARFRIRGKRMLRTASAMKVKWNHKKSKDIREQFGAMAKAAYEDNRQRAEAFKTARSKDSVLFDEQQVDRAQDEDAEAIAVRVQEDIEADCARRDVLEDSWTWTLGVPFRDLVEVGSGVDGQVFRASFQGQSLALKLAKGRGLQDPMQRAAAGGLDVAEEFAVLGALGQHPNVVRAFAVLSSSLGRPALVLEWATESLQQMARRLKDDRLETSPAGRRSLLNLFQQFVVGLSYVHSRSFLHLDVKPTNILVFDGVRAAVADFGHSEHVSDTGCTVIGNRVYTEAFRCAECLMAADRKVRVTFAGDVWAAAVSLFEICCPKKASLWTIPPATFLRDTEEQTAKAIREMALAKSSKVMPYDEVVLEVLKQTFVPANRRLALPGLLKIIQKAVRSARPPCRLD